MSKFGSSPDEWDYEKQLYEYCDEEDVFYRNIQEAKESTKRQNFWHFINANLFYIEKTEDKIGWLMGVSQDCIGDPNKESILAIVSQRLFDCKSWQMQKLEIIRSAYV